MARTRKSKKRRRFTAEQRRSAVEYLREQRAREGRSWRSVAEELGVTEGMLRRWCEKYPETSKPEFRAVEVVAPKSARPVVVTPRGIRVEGLGVEEIAILLQSLSS